MFDYKVKLFKKKRNDIIATKEMRIEFSKKFFLRYKKFIIYKKDEQN